MFTETQLHFFKEKITSIETALLINQSDSVLRLPNRVVHVSYVDENGYVWFLIPRPTQHLSQLDTRFRVRLSFSRKGSAWLSRLEGYAYLVSDPEYQNLPADMPGWMREKAIKDELLIKVKASKVHFTPRKQPRTTSPVQSWNHSFHRLIQNQRLIFNQLRMKLHF
jgi:hypothetical protein